MDCLPYFSVDYPTARDRFLDLAEQCGARVESYPVATAEASGIDLTIDRAWIGSPEAKVVLMVTSGLHGVEGFFGSAAQLAFLSEILPLFDSLDGFAIDIWHALNPYGFHALRRADQRNIDLNRNFLPPGQSFQGVSPLYAAIDPLLNPAYAPRRCDGYSLRLWLRALRSGKQALKQAIAVGQYEYPKGLFYGGDGPARTHQVLAETLPRDLQDVQRVLHIDFHTGLGEWADYKLLTMAKENSEIGQQLHAWFGPVIECVHSGSTAYVNHGGIDEWIERTFAKQKTISLCAEFGTYGPSTVLAALRQENQTFHYSAPDSPERERAKDQLREVFVPSDPTWRNHAVNRAVDVLQRAMSVCEFLLES